MITKTKKSQNAISTTNEAVSVSPSAPNLDSLKMKIRNDNENELEELKEKELKNLRTEHEELTSPNHKPVVDRSLKPHDVDKRASFYNFRRITIPSDLTKIFLLCAETNTNKNIETCGILAGKLV